MGIYYFTQIIKTTRGNALQSTNSGGSRNRSRGAEFLLPLPSFLLPPLLPHSFFSKMKGGGLKEGLHCLWGSRGGWNPTRPTASSAPMLLVPWSSEHMQPPTNDIIAPHVLTTASLTESSLTVATKHVERVRQKEPCHCHCHSSHLDWSTYAPIVMHPLQDPNPGGWGGATRTQPPPGNSYDASVSPAR